MSTAQRRISYIVLIVCFIGLTLFACARLHYAAPTAVILLSTVVPFAIYIASTEALAVTSLLSVENAFLVCYCILGIVNLVFVAPFSAPDSYEQFLRAYEIANGTLITPIDSVDFVEGSTNKAGFAYLDAGLLPVGVDRTPSFAEIMPTLGAQISSTETQLYAYSTMSTYSPISFLPSVVAIFILHFFTSSVWVLVYGCRIFTLAFCGAVMYLSIRILPYAKTLVALSALFPIVVQLYTTMSPDVMVIAFTVALLSYVLHLKQSKTKANTVLLAILCLCLALTKIVYLPICLIVLAIPQQCFEGRFGKKQKWVTIGLLAAASIVVNIVWLKVASSYLIEYREGVNGAGQVSAILANPIGYFGIMLSTATTSAAAWVEQIFGSHLSWLNVYPSKIFIYASMAVFIGAVIASKVGKDARNPLSLQDRLPFIAAIIIVLLLIFTSLYVQWTPVGNPVIEGIQGRYFIPLIPLLLVTFCGSEPKNASPWIWIGWTGLLLLITSAPVNASFM